MQETPPHERLLLTRDFSPCKRLLLARAAGAVGADGAAGAASADGSTGITGATPAAPEALAALAASFSVLGGKIMVHQFNFFLVSA